MRKQLLEYDDVSNDQRKVIYEQRREIMSAADVSGVIRDLREEVIHDMVTQAIPFHSYVEQWDVAGLQERVKDILALALPIAQWAHEDGIAETEIEERIKRAAEEKLKEKTAILDEGAMRHAEKAALLGTLDQAWKDHLLALDHVRQGIHLRGYGQRDPLNEYSREAFGLFQLMLESIREEVTKALMHAGMRLPSLEEIMERNRVVMQELSGAEAGASFGTDALPEGMVIRHPASNSENPQAVPMAHQAFDPANPATWGNMPRNAACPCGSGKKYKHCHGRAS